MIDMTPSIWLLTSVLEQVLESLNGWYANTATIIKKFLMIPNK